MSVKKSKVPKFMQKQHQISHNRNVCLENYDPNFSVIPRRKTSKKAKKSFRNLNKDRFYYKRNNDIGYTSLTNTIGKYNKDVRYYKVKANSSSNDVHHTNSEP